MEDLTNNLCFIGRRRNNHKKANSSNNLKLLEADRLKSILRTDIILYDADNRENNDKEDYIIKARSLSCIGKIVSKTESKSISMIMMNNNLNSSSTVNNSSENLLQLNYFYDVDNFHEGINNLCNISNLLLYCY